MQSLGHKTLKLKGDDWKQLYNYFLQGDDTLGALAV